MRRGEVEPGVVVGPEAASRRSRRSGGSWSSGRDPRVQRDLGGLRLGLLGELGQRGVALLGLGLGLGDELLVDGVGEGVARESRLTSWPRPVSRLLLELALLPEGRWPGLKARLSWAAAGVEAGVSTAERAPSAAIGDGGDPGRTGTRREDAEQAASRGRGVTRGAALAGRRHGCEPWAFFGRRVTAATAARAATVRSVVTHRMKSPPAGRGSAETTHVADRATCPNCNGTVTDPRNRSAPAPMHARRIVSRRGVDNCSTDRDGLACPL